jgi:aspartyl-tRNA(Asn)/glutamyl-tRNA(Gln) amidotransferase subunit A
MQEWLTATAADLGRGIGAGEIDPVDLTLTYLAAIDAHPLRDRIYFRVTRDRALAEAEAARQRAANGRRLSPLDGVPVSWKDLFDTAGVATEAGSALLAGRVPARDARVLRNATALGTVCLGKTHMSELAFSGLGFNPITQTSPNVNDAEAVAGGSSSGAAASVAFGLAPCAIGSDTGGSVRLPAAWNDLVGLRTTPGHLSLEGVVPLCPTFDTVGPLARSVEDAALMYGILAGGRSPDLKGAILTGRRFAILDTVAMDDVRPAPRGAFIAAVKALEAAGATVETIEVPAVEKAMALSGVLYAGQAYGIWRDVIEANPDAMFHQIRDRFRAGQGFSAADYVAAWTELDRLRTEYGRATASYDAVICPSAPNLPPSLKRLAEDAGYYATENLLALRNTRIGNLMGTPALTLPTGGVASVFVENFIERYRDTDSDFT